MTPRNGVSDSSKLGDSSSGILKVRPSSPPVKSDSCEASVWKAAATASVIIEKKIARTRSENRPIGSASTNDSASDASEADERSRPSPRPCCVDAIAMP